MLCDLYRYAVVVMCALVLMACVCRIDQMRRDRNCDAWFLVYVQSAMFAFGVLIDLARLHSVDWYDSAGVGGLLLYMVLTRERWRHGPDLATDASGRGRVP